MGDESIPLNPHREGTTTHHPSRRPVDLADVKAQRYVGKFFHRRQIGRKILAEVEGNYGIYTVSISRSQKGVTGHCSCYIGARGECHHVRALAQTFAEDPGSFTLQESRTRRRPPTLEALEAYLESGSLEHLLAALQFRGIGRHRIARLLGTTRRELDDALRAERGHEPLEGQAALKLACCYLLEWSEATAGGDDLARALSGHSHRELVALIGGFVRPLPPQQRETLLARWGSSPSVTPGARQPDGEALLEEIDLFVADCERGFYPGSTEVATGRGEYTELHRPESEAVELLDGFFSEAGRLQEAGGHAAAVAAYEKLFEFLWGHGAEWFGYGEISGRLETDLRSASLRYLASLGRISPPEEYVRRARALMGLSYPDLLVSQSSPEQLMALEADLLRELEATEGPGGHMPYSVNLLRQLYEYQGRARDSLELCRRWRHHYPSLRAPLMDHAEAIGDWADLESLVREAIHIAESRPRPAWGPDPALARLEGRLSRALERQGRLSEALGHAQQAFRHHPDMDGYRRAGELGGRISMGQRQRWLDETVSFLRARLAAEETMDPRQPSRGGLLLARVLLAEGMDSGAFDLAMQAGGATRIQLLNLVAGHLLGLDGEAEGTRPAGEDGLSRGAECYRRLVELFIEARGRANYAIAATYAALMRDVYLRLGRRDDFDRWYRELMDGHLRFRALREELRRRLGPEQSGGESAT